VSPADGRILVSGSTGGVGSISVAILAKAGYQVTAVTGKSEEHALLAGLGATDIITRNEATDSTGRMLLREKWAGVIDTVGGNILSAAIRATRYGGMVTCCGNVASPELNISVYPFILTGVTLRGIDSAKCLPAIRQRIWNKLASEWKITQLDDLAKVVTLDHLSPEIDNMLKGKIKGRIVVRL
jgi:putative YhdH/YhfP family quinone oxidoreductase